MIAVIHRPQGVLSPWLKWWFPPLLLIIVMGVRIVDPQAYEDWVIGEIGLVELATPLAAFIGFLIAVRMSWRLKSLPDRGLLRAWIVLLGLACFYLAGEELSWGQQLFHWQTPEAVAEINDQQETNLHNISSWFDQKPRLLLELWVLIGGILVPLAEHVRGSKFERGSFSYWFWPTLDCMPTAILAICVRLPPRIKDLFELPALPYEIRYSEPQEYYFALFLVLYLLSLTTRIAADSAER